jgi:alcohol dehydrogenase (cytochrome c)
VSIPVSGGGTWTSFSLDPETRRLYVPGGNPGPDFAVRPRGGDDLYTGSLVVLDAITGDYIHHYQLVPKDFHDWDVSGAPTLAHTQSGRSIVAIAPKNGMLYSFDRATNQLLFETRINRAINVDVPLAVGDAVRFCPGTAGGAEWNGPAYDPVNDLIYVGEVDWCTTVEVDDEETLRSAPIGAPWFGHRTKNPFDIAGKFDDPLNWGGWLYAVDAETGKWRWRDRSNYPVQSGVTPTAGGVVFFGDMGGNFYALDADSGERLWGQKIGGAIGGGVVTYTTHGIQRVAVAVGFTSVIWPTERTTGKIVVLGID